MNANGNFGRSYFGGSTGGVPVVPMSVYHQQQSSSYYHQTYPGYGKLNFLWNRGGGRGNMDFFSNRNFCTSLQYNSKTNNINSPTRNLPTTLTNYTNRMSIKRDTYGNGIGKEKERIPSCVSTPNATLSTAIALGINGTGNCSKKNEQNKFIKGIKNIVNGFCYPKLNCDFYSDHHRYYNPKYRNNYLKNKNFDNYYHYPKVDVSQQQQQQQQQKQSQQQPHQPEQNINTIVYDTGLNKNNNNNNYKINNKNLSTTAASQQQENLKLNQNSTLPNNNNSNEHLIESKNNSGVNMTIFSFDDFPELPAPKKPFLSSNYQNHQQQQGKQKCSNFRIFKMPGKSNLSFSHNEQRGKLYCNNNNSIQSHNNNNNNANITDNDKNELKPDSECTSEDSFVILKNGCKSPISTSCCSSSCDSQTKFDCSNLSFHNNKRYNNNNRIRSLSECSDDSFVICFTEDAAEGVIELCDNDNDNDDDDILSDASSYSSGDDDIDDEGINDKNDIEKNCKILQKTNSINSTPEIKTNEGKNQPDFEIDDFGEKKVRFNTKPEIHVMHVWDYAYRAARRGSWENYARDRSRFQHRIENLKHVLDPVLNKTHRDKIYKERYCDNKTSLVVNS